MDVDFSFLTTKKMVYHSGVPLPFSVYEGMVETIYMLSNSVAYSSVVSPGLYVTMRNFARQFAGELSVVDDLLGMCVIHGDRGEDRPIHYSVQTRSIIDQLTALNRIEWQCPHAEVAARIPEEGVVWVANPLAFLHYNRSNEINIKVVNMHPKTTFIIPMGEGNKARISLQFYANHVTRPVFLGHVPCAFIDDSFAIIPADGVSFSGVRGLHITKAVKTVVSGEWSLDKERKLFQHLYG